MHNEGTGWGMRKTRRKMKNRSSLLEEFARTWGALPRTQLNCSEAESTLNTQRVQGNIEVDPSRQQRISSLLRTAVSWRQSMNFPPGGLGQTGVQLSSEEGKVP